MLKPAICPCGRTFKPFYARQIRCNRCANQDFRAVDREKLTLQLLSMLPKWKATPTTGGYRFQWGKGRGRNYKIHLICGSSSILKGHKHLYYTNPRHGKVSIGGVCCYRSKYSKQNRPYGDRQLRYRRADDSIEPLSKWHCTFHYCTTCREIVPYLNNMAQERGIPHILHVDATLDDPYARKAIPSWCEIAD